MTLVRLDEGPDTGAIAHLGDPYAEQRMLLSGAGQVDLSHRGVITIAGPDRLGWLHSLTSQHLEALAPGEGATAYVLSPQGHIEHVLFLVDDGQTTSVHTEPGHGAALVEWLSRMIFLKRVEVTLASEAFAVIWRPGPIGESPFVARAASDSLGGHELFVPRAEVAAVLEERPLAGMWAYEALRIEAGVPRVFVDTDHRTIPNELGVPGHGVHLDKGCYRGQETVARVHTLGRPPRRLVRLMLDGSVDRLPEMGAELRLADRVVGFVGSSARHHELGPIALGLVKRNVAVDADLLADGVAAAQEALVDPEVGLHVRARL